MKLDASHVPALVEDLEKAAVEMKAGLPRDAAGWASGAPGKWTAGQHAEHATVSLEAMLRPFERNAEMLRNGALGPRPKRGLAQALVIWLLMREPFPRGGKAPAFAEPGPTPSREAVFARLDAAVAGFRDLALRLTPEECRRLWILNPFREGQGWHYRLFEALRVQAGHLRHHLRMARAGS